MMVTYGYCSSYTSCIRDSTDLFNKRTGTFFVWTPWEQDYLPSWENLKRRDGKINKGHSWKPFCEADITFQVIIFICDFHLMLNIWIILQVFALENVLSLVYLFKFLFLWFTIKRFPGFRSKQTLLCLPTFKLLIPSLSTLNHVSHTFFKQWCYGFCKSLNSAVVEYHWF